MEREKLGSRLGFIMLSAGCAIGVGNVWKFPYMVGENGGGAFVLLYLFFLLILGIPVLTIEFSIGRAAQKSPVRLYSVLAPKKSKWFLHGYVAMAGNYLLMMFYTVVTGWMLYYFLSTAAGNFTAMDTAQVSSAFGELCQDPTRMVLYMAAAVLIGFFVCSFGLQKGVERITKIMMIALLVIMIVLAVHSFTMPGANEGLSFYLKPDFSKINGNVIVGAMNQAFFTLSIGMGSMAIFGSYIDKTHSLLGESINVVVLDTFVAIVSGLIIFPACFTYGVTPNAGPSLIFETLPNIFNNMPLGRLWGSLFFLFMSFAAFSTVLAVFENILSCFMDLTKMSRKKACLINCAALIVLSLPCALGFNLLSNIHPFGGTSGIMDLEDFLVSNIILPLGSLVYVLFCVTKRGWGWDNFIAEANAGKGLKIKKWMRGYMTYVLPLIIIVIFVIGMISFFS